MIYAHSYESSQSVALHFLAGRNSSVRSVIDVVPVSAVLISSAPKTRSGVVVGAIVPKMPGIISAGTFA